METEIKRRIDAILHNTRTQLDYVNISVRSDILEIVRAMSLVSGRPVVEVLKDFKSYIDLHITIANGKTTPVKRGRGRPRKEVK